LIIRVLRGQVQPESLAEFRAQAQGALSDAHGHDGFLCGHVGRQANGDGSEEVLFVSVWRDLNSLYRWVGGTDLLDTPLLNRGASNVFETYEVQHYEVWEAGDQAELEDQAEGSAG
jgi:heme-degrading monooxygenase HmoA